MLAVVFRAGMTAYAARYWLPVTRHAERPGRAQERVLRHILTANRTTQFGVEHRFAEVRTPEDFRQRVPVQDYETLREYIERQRCSGAAALTTEPPMFYAQTSGSTGKPKYIPVCASTLRTHRAEQALFTYLQYRACPAAFSGKALGIMGAAVEDRLDSGHAVGSISGYLYESLPSSVQSRFVVPPQLSSIVDYDLKYLMILRLAIASSDITYLGSPNPSTFLRLLAILNERRDGLARSLDTGSLPELDALDAATRAVMTRRLRPDPARAAQLRGAAPLTFASLWPGIRLLTTWTGGSCGIALDKLRATLPTGTKVMELGYQSTECRGTIALEAETPGGLPPLHHHFFEFVQQDHWDSGRPEFLGLGELAPGTRYYILLTTGSGLYRYFMNDLVEVTGRYRNTPLIRFVQKGKGVTSLTGEKLYEAQVIQAVQDTARRHGFVPSFFLLVADEASTSYNLFLETDRATRPSIAQAAADVDHRLGELNVEYQSKRASGRLAPLTVAWLEPGAGEAYKAACVRAGQREGQFKPAVLQYRRDLQVSFEPYVIG
ncbi:MAG: GH3 auxin-responsive promoter family protein [Vicinamibacterales bacterium]